MEELFGHIMSEYGFGVAMSFGVGLLFVWLLKLVMAQQEKRESCWTAIIEKQATALEQHTTQAQNFHSTMAVASDFQRQEHTRMINILDGIKDAVGRINGYKHE